MDSRVEEWGLKAAALGAKGGKDEGDSTEYTDDAIVLGREALEIYPSSHPVRAGSLSWLANHLWDRYQQLKTTVDLDEAIDLELEALELRPSGHADRFESLMPLARRLSARYELNGDTEDLEQAIVFGEEALMLCLPDDPQRLVLLNGHTSNLCGRYELLEDMEDLDSAIMLGRIALELCAQDDGDRCVSRILLATNLSVRYKNLGKREDLDESVSVGREAIEICPPGHREQPVALTNQAGVLGTQFKELGGTQYLDEAISLMREALKCYQPGDDRRTISLNNLALFLSSRYSQLGALKDIDEAIVVAREALGVCTPIARAMCLGNLSDHLEKRYKQLGANEDIDEAIAFDREAQELYQPGNPGWPSFLTSRAKRLSTRFKQTGQSTDKEEMFSFYVELADVPLAVSSSHLSAVGEWIQAAEEFQHPKTLLAYETALRLLDQYLTTIPSLSERLDVVEEHASLGVNAFSAGLRHGSPARAVELLEQGRSIVWNQLIRLRPSLHTLRALGPAGNPLADKFTEIASALCSALHSTDEDELDQVSQLNDDLRTVVSLIRDLPGLSRFLLPPSFPDLQQAASEGPVVIVNASEYGCDALVILCDRDPIHVPLQITKQRAEELFSIFGDLAVTAARVDATNELVPGLRRLWEEVVSPIAELLQTIHPCQSRIWWCPTAEFSFLPFHAAGQYAEGKHNFSDMYISSYTTSLSALNRARRPSLSNPTKQKHVVIIGRDGETELSNIGQGALDGPAIFTRIEGTDLETDRVVNELAKNQWAHFDCPGLPDWEQPFTSAFALHDSQLSIERLVQCDLDDAEFAYLSTGHTALSNEEHADEVIHLASAVSLVGYRSVIGTLWEVNVKDSEDKVHAIAIASKFYEKVVDGKGRLDYTRAACALHEAVTSLVDLPLELRVAYVHFGA